MTQVTGSLQLVRRNTIQLVLMAAIAVLGISIGRWVVPVGENTSGGSSVLGNFAVPSTANNFADSKFAQRGSFGEVDEFAGVSVPTFPSGAISNGDSKFAQRGSFGEVDEFADVSVPTFPTTTNSYRDSKFQQRGSFGEVDEFGGVSAPASTAPLSLEERKSEQRGSLDDILFGPQ